MVAIVSGLGLGLFNSSGSVLGGAGSIGSSGSGRGGERIAINSATGNLILQNQDERLSAVGLDLALVRTYNSRGLMDDDNGDNWRLGLHQRVYMASGTPTPNAAGSIAVRVAGDGSESRYTFNGSVYTTTEGDGAHDTLTYVTTDDLLFPTDPTPRWIWTDGSGRNTEVYD